MGSINVSRGKRIGIIVLTFLMASIGVLALGWASRAAAAPGTVVRYVDAIGGSDDSDCTNPADPCQTIQYAIDQSVMDDELRVAEGSYEGFGLNLPLSILGGYEASTWTRDIEAYPTVVDGGGVWLGHLVHINSGADLFLEGFTVQGGAPPHDGGGFGVFSATATISATVVQSNTALGGGGLYGHNAQISLVNSILQHNVVTDSGGAVAVCCNSALSFENVTVRGNWAQLQGGGLWACESSLTFVNGQIEGNTAASDYGGGIYACGGTTVGISRTAVTSNTAGSGGGLALWGSRGTVDESWIGGNTSGGGGGGVGVWDGSIVTATRSILSNNTSHSQGGGMHLAGAFDQATISNSLVNGNRGVEGSGSGLDNWGTMTLMNVTVADNPCGSPGMCSGGVSNRDPAAQLNITNSILAGHAQGDLTCATGTCDVAYSDIADSSWPGTGNISADPMFIDPVSDDYHLPLSSPAVNAGTAAGAPVVDLDGTTRDAWPDMGAYEWSGFRIYLPSILKN